MGFGELFSSLNTYRALDTWTGTLGQSVSGMGKVGYKANRTTFQRSAGNVVNDYGPASPVNLKTKIAEQTLLADTYVDWSQGDLVESEGENHFAVRGEGFFMLMDDQGDFFYTRAGQFEYRNGRIQTPEGLTLVDKSLIQSMGQAILPANLSTTAGDILNDSTAILYDPTITAAEIDANESSWLKAKAGTTAGQMWLPYVAGTTYDEAGTSYQNQAVTLKRDFLIDTPVTSADISVTVDDWAWVYVNGQLLNPADVMTVVGVPNEDFGGSPVFNGTTQFNIAPYLRKGVNSIQIYGVENLGGNTLSTAGTISLADGTTMNIENYYTPGDTRWSVKLVGDSPASADPNTPPWYGALLEPPPSQLQEDKMFNVELKDMVLARLENRDGLRYSKYGDTIFEAGDDAGELTLWEAANSASKGLGTIYQNRLEVSNVDADNLPAEMKIAQATYEGLANIFEMRYWMIDLMFQRLVP